MVRPVDPIDLSQTVTIISEITYELMVLPCAISEVTTPVPPTTIQYTIGEDGFSFGQILFESDKACDFEFSYQMSGAPSNLAYSLVNMDFELQQTFNLSLRN